MSELFKPEDYYGLCDSICREVESRMPILEGIRKNLESDFSSNLELMSLVHSWKARVKDLGHLRDKLIRRAEKKFKAGAGFDVTEENVYEKINDILGFRILHLHTTQFKRINELLQEIFEEHRYNLIEGPIAKVWDNEYRDYFHGIGVAAEDNDRMYTSVHYVVSPNKRTIFTAEIQVRTLAEELWGEVDHTINYPVQSENESCREQIKVLARMTSGCTRLVDSIFNSHANDKDKSRKSGGG